MNNFKNVSFGILVGAGGVAFLTGFFGFFLASKCCAGSKGRSFAVVYGIFLSFTWIIIIVLGAIVTAVSYGSAAQISGFCTGQLSTNQLFQAISNGFQTMDSGINSYINANMCSQACPCPSLY